MGTAFVSQSPVPFLVSFCDLASALLFRLLSESPSHRRAEWYYLPVSWPRHRLCVLPLCFFIAGGVQAQNAKSEVSPQAVRNAETVSYCELLRHPGKFTNQTVRVRAVYETDFEKSVIVSPSCSTPVPMMWVTFDEHWESRSGRQARKTVSRAKWRAPLDVVFVGRFKTDGRYGHMDMFPLEIEVYKVEVAVAASGVKTD